MGVFFFQGLLAGVLVVTAVVAVDGRAEAWSAGFGFTVPSV